MNAVYVGSDNQFSRTVATATQDSEHISVLNVNCMMTRTSNSSTAQDVEYAEYVPINRVDKKHLSCVSYLLNVQSVFQMSLTFFKKQDSETVRQ